MCSPTEYIPHREAEPLRLCAGCGALLASRNETATCWQCDPYWSDVDLDEAPISTELRLAIGDAIDQILAEA
jgi:hypothetical protein